MSSGLGKKSDAELIATTHNMSRYFVEQRHVSWILLIAVLCWGVYSYCTMEKRKDPLFTNFYAVAVCPWPGASAEKIEQLVTRKIEEKISENLKVSEIKSDSRSSVSIVNIKLDERVRNSAAEFDDLALRLQDIHDLPEGAGPIRFLKDYGDVTNMMITVASPKADDVEISLRADAIKRAIEKTRAGANRQTKRVSIVVCFPYSTPVGVPRRQRDIFAHWAHEDGILQDIRVINGQGFVGVDGTTHLTDNQINQVINKYIYSQLKISYLHPDLWLAAIIREPSDTKAKLAEVAGDKYSYKELDDYTDFIQRTLQTLPTVSRITRSGVFNEQINLEFSQERLASYGIQPVDLRERLAAQNITDPAGMIETSGKNLRIVPSGEFKSEKEIGSVIIGTSESGTPIYMRDVVDIGRSYESPPRFLTNMTWKDKQGHWQRTRAITLAVFMRSQEHIDKFGKAIDETVAVLKTRLPQDLIIERTSDQPKQVEENIDLFMSSLYEAIVLVVITALIGFWEWRSALLIALSIPLTLAMTYGMMFMLGIDLQQCSIAALIISLGLLVDDPVVAGDAIKRGLTEGVPREAAAWLGPTRLAHAIMFATITNIAAYLPLLMITGEVGQFIFSLPIVITCSLVASRIVSMSFVPFLGYYLLRPESERVTHRSKLNDIRETIKEKYMRGGTWVLNNRLLVFGASVVLLIGGYAFFSKLKTSFFPNDVFNICWVDVWMPEDAPLSATDEAAQHVEKIIEKVCSDYGREEAGKSGKPAEVLDSITTFLGGSGPRFWNSVLPELDQLNYSQVIIKFKNKHDTDVLIPRLQRVLSSSVAEARCDVRQLEGGKPVGMPVSIRISGDDPQELRRLAREVSKILRANSLTERTRDDWGASDFTLKLNIDSDRAYLAGLTNKDIANSARTGLYGYRVDTMREGDKQIPIVARLRLEESSQINDLSDLYVYSTNSQAKIPVRQVATIDYGMETEKIRRRNQFRTITVGCYPIYGALPSEIMDQIRPQLKQFEAKLLPGYKMEIGGEEEEQVKSFTEMAVVMATSVISIFICLVLQFQNAVKPIIVFAAIPYGLLGALLGLAIMGKPFGFPAFMGVASLTGVIVSHVIVLFDFIETKREEGMPLREALLQSSMMRLRPVLITVGATVLGFIPLAMHGGPLWEPLCYAQIGGLTIATFVTLGLVPVIYAIFVLDLKLVNWEE